jgi:hypothetical protein
LGLLATCGWSLLAQAQVPYLDPLPFYARSDTAAGRILVVSYDRFDDEISHWAADRVGLTGILATGRRSCLFVRAHYLAFDSGELSTLQRWPQLADEAPSDWPGEHRMVGWTRPEVGVLAQLALPGLGETECVLAAALPVGRDELYPLSAASLPLRLLLGKSLVTAASWQAHLAAGQIIHLDSSRQWLQPEAFPSGTVLAVRCQWRPQGPRSVSVALSLQEELLGDRRSTNLGCQVWWPYGLQHAIGLSVQRELAGRAERSFGSLVTLSWRLQASADEEADASAR